MTIDSDPDADPDSDCSNMPNFELPRAARHAFSLIELLVVVAIISILVGMVSVAASSARQNAYRARAQAEVRELSNALKAYWITYGFWHPEIESAWNSENSPIE